MKLNFLKQISLFENSHSIKNLPVELPFKKHFYLVKEQSRYSKLMNVILKMRSGEILESDYIKKWSEGLIYTTKYQKDGKEAFFYHRLDWLIFLIKRIKFKDKQQEVIYLHFSYSKALYEEIKKNFEFELNKQLEVIIIPYSSENFLKLIQLKHFPKLMIELNGFQLYQKLN